MTTLGYQLESGHIDDVNMKLTKNHTYINITYNRAMKSILIMLKYWIEQIQKES